MKDPVIIETTDYRGKKVKITLHMTCCDACQRYHKFYFTCRIHYLWLKFTKQPTEKSNEQ